MFDPGGAAEARDAVLVGARLGDVVANGVRLAGVAHAPRAALALGHRRELAVDGRARQRPAVHLPLLRDNDTNTKGEVWVGGTQSNNNRCLCTSTKEVMLERGRFCWCVLDFGAYSTQEFTILLFVITVDPDNLSSRFLVVLFECG